MKDEAQRYPLAWPLGWPRAKHRRHGAFRHQGRPITATAAVARLSDELQRLGAVNEVLSTNVRTRLDGSLRLNEGAVGDPGAAIYFTLKKAQRVLACDSYFTLADNIAAIAAHIEALRRIDRYGVGSLEQAFAGYAALPVNTAANWRDVFGFPEGSRPTLDAVNEKFVELARAAHPDAGGTHEQMARLSEARAFARKELAA